MSRPKLFGTDGIRGIANTELTPELAFRLGEAVVKYLGDAKSSKFVIGRDTRRSGAMLQSALIAGITSAGGDVLLANMIPTPGIAFLTRRFRADGGIVISASHNPPEHNGLKVFSRDGFKLSDDLESLIEIYLNTHTSFMRPDGTGIGKVTTLEDATAHYVHHIVDAFEPGTLDGLKVALDCAHGASAVSSPKAFEMLGAKVSAINTDYNGDDINMNCGSTHLKKLQKFVRKGDFDLGIAHDGDADRTLAVDENGAIIDGDQIIAIVAKYMQENDLLLNNTVVSTVMANMGFEKAMDELGIQTVKTKVGDRFVLEQMQTMNANLGGEQSGHVILLDHNTTGDGLLVALMLAHIVAQSDETLSELAKVMTKYPQVMVNVQVRNKEHLVASARLAEAIDAAEEQLGDHGRVLVRASGTEALVRVMSEAATIEEAQEVVDELVEVVKEELN
ncbi:MAG: phosphoglucosamine mutase [Coriobacteriia bacterium]|nr:phosphoglucosamine mutase [Coriobacteriia bacterium]